MSINEWGDRRGRGYSPEVVARLQEGVRALKTAYVYAHRIDWLLSDDDGEESFLERLEEELSGMNKHLPEVLGASRGGNVWEGGGDTMNLKDGEHDELIKQFEKDYPHAPTRKEPKEIWTKGNIYCHGETNALFLAYRLGYSLGRWVERNETPS